MVKIAHPTRNEEGAVALFWSILLPQRGTSVGEYVHLLEGIETGPTVFKKVVFIGFLVVFIICKTHAPQFGEE